MTRYYSMMESPVGPLCLVADAQGLCGVFFEDHRHQVFDPEWVQDDALKIFQKTRPQLQEYFAGQRQQFDLPIGKVSGTPFQQEVWQALRSIPYGETRSYGALAQSIGRPKAVRALGAANGRNPLSIIVPCHRVIAGNGDLQGYAGGLERKRRLLEWESQWLAKS
ncbi:methylated-DNA--[protein]-cysteine S-methyltransferase [Undibacterium cyanobacteriorum]|uniref:Methylated-DNA--protein-cysteine methyltransferase n=1 Tax=Undibacterium cyanobacteriorum TaxID=3073561 RepID=A0ABY9RKY5_9BURK|nr:methylated-DNA--[protein]-cysteine S-methyltransferase [Undibacterium sp. 20NA77.5]WMW80696.1 methylated-DNA--[protein]-cysteine S-methyltransferase [Undibacterium sp. 20NA77.5]